MSGEGIQGEGDRFLIEEIRDGSADAFRRLVDRFGGRLKAYAARKLQGSGLEPEDAVQDTFLSLLKNIERLEGVRSLQAYLYTILRCRVADLARARGPMGAAVSLDAGDSRRGASSLASPENTPSTYARREEAVGARHTILADVLDELLGRLKNERKFRDLKVLEVIFSLGRPNQDAAEIAETSEPTVSRTRKALIEELGKSVRAHPKADAIVDLPSGDDVSALITEIWNDNQYSCLKRSTLGSYALGVLEDDWAGYARFHLETVKCDYCLAHLADVEKGGDEISSAARERLFTSSAGFLK